MTSPLRLSHPRGIRPHLVVLQGGRAAASAPFVVAPPAVLRLAQTAQTAPSAQAQRPVWPGAMGEAQARADEADLLRCRRLVSSWR
jgi:hypothetical protein